MDHRENILKIVKEKGPLLPSQINKELRTNVLFASAMLSEMVDQKKIRLTSMKVGGSPLYYCDGQETALEQFAGKLGDAEKNAFSLIKNSKILRDRDQEPQTRVALREIKDFAIPLEVTANGQSDLFWKFYLVQDEEANALIKDYINTRAQKPAEPPKPKEVQAKIDTAPPKPQESTPAPTSPPRSAPPPQPASPPVQAQAAPAPASTPAPAPKEPVTSVKMTPLEESEVPEFEYQPAFSFSTLIDTDEPVKIEKKEPEPEPEPAQPEFPEDDEFFNKVRSFFDTSGIEILGFELVRKGGEYDFTIRLPSNVGHLNYYCKAKSKAKINDGDLSTAFVHGQIKKLPILFLTVGDLTKRAEDLLNKEFKNMFVKRI
jgi:hypothetical protein